MHLKKILLTFLLLAPCVNAKNRHEKSFLKRHKKTLIVVAGATACGAAALYKCCDVVGWIRSLFSGISIGGPKLTIDIPKSEEKDLDNLERNDDTSSSSDEKDLDKKPSKIRSRL